jgi:hypothetical protein
MDKSTLNPGFVDDIQTQTTNYDRKMRDRISIDVADMHIALQKFKINVIRRNFTTPLLGLIGAWLPVVSSDFKEIGVYSASEVKGFYVGIVVCISIAILKTWILPLKRWSPKNKDSNSDDPENLAYALYRKGTNDN